MKYVWVTGASSGIGQATARLLAEKGCYVYVTARQKTALQSLSDDYEHIEVLEADLTCDDDVTRIQQYFADADRCLDAVIVNAGTCEYMDDAVFDLDVLKRVYDINVFSAAQTIDIALPALKRSQQGGHIVGVSSMSVYLPFTRAEYYGSSKAAFSYYLESLAVDLRHEAVDVSIAYPGFVETPLTQKNDFPMPFLISAEQAAEHLYKVLVKRPKVYAFPYKMHMLLKFIGAVPGLWGILQQPAKR